MEEISKNSNEEWKVELNRKNNKFEDALSYFETYFLEPIEKLFEDRVVSQHDKLLLDKVKYITKKLKSGNIEACKKYLQWVEVKHFVENPEKYIEIEEPSKEKVENYKREFGQEWEKVLLSYQFTQLLGNPITIALLKEEFPWDLHEIIREEKLLSYEDIWRAVLFPPAGRPTLRQRLVDEFGKIKRHYIKINWDSWEIDGHEYKIEKLNWSDEEIEDYIEKWRRKFFII